MSQTALFIIILLTLISGFGIVIYFLNEKISKLTNSTNDNSAVLLQNQLNSLAHSLDNKLSDTNRIIQDQLSNSNQRLHNQNISNNELLHKISENNNKILQEVTEKLVKVEDTNREVVNFAKQLQSLENILKNPKQRGLYGEYFLETILSNILPKSVYKIQYPFRDGVIVDAVIFTKDKVIPIDAKFSLEGFNKIIECEDKLLVTGLEKEFIKDIKNRIDETSKYVKPEEGTIDVAFMFIPSDSVYQEAMKLGCGDINIDLIGYAYSKKVIIVSPTSFFAYLQTLLKALNTLQIEEQVQEVIKHLNETSKYLRQFEEEMARLGKNISTVVNTYNKTTDEAHKLSKRISRVTKNDGDLLLLEKIKEEIN